LNRPIPAFLSICNKTGNFSGFAAGIDETFALVTVSDQENSMWPAIIRSRCNSLAACRENDNCERHRGMMTKHNSISRQD